MKILTCCKHNLWFIKDLLVRVEKGLKKGFVVSLCLGFKKTSYTFSVVTFMTEYSFNWNKRSCPDSWIIYKWWKFTLVVNKRKQY